MPPGLTAITRFAAAYRAISFLNQGCIDLLKRLMYQPFESAEGATFNAPPRFQTHRPTSNLRNLVVLLAT
jgi:hypothetical protein